ncbi:helix-turn-helix domain-containing protein [Variovorax sp. MHTC-1]|uniref:helix-turn-helix domain-containing protein n=1 Tax=Variovorax sp. MHTC-1 TaxID=2495593 RepID=UPI0021AF08B9|nr:XRE family transcriptional regulator [Variovorax sp. MHTC-1]
MVRTLRPPPPPPAKKPRLTRSAAAPVESIGRDVMGERLRSIRKAGKLTLKELSVRSGVALSTLSKMELGQISISYEKFAAVARALNVDISRLFDPAARRAGKAAPTFVHSALGSAPSYTSDQYEYRMLCADHPAKIMEPMHGRILARHESEFADFIRHPGHEFCMVLSGTVRIRFETGESVLVRRNESVYFDSGVGHIYLSVGKAQAQVVVVMSGSAAGSP